MTKKTKNTKTAPVATPAPMVPVAAVPEAEKIWNEIKDKEIEMFALPNQTVSQHCTPFPVEPSKLYLTIRSSAVLPSLEAACGSGYVVEMADRFVIVKRAEPSLASLLPKR